MDKTAARAASWEPAAGPTSQWHDGISEIGYLVIALVSFAAALYALWLGSAAAGLVPPAYTPGPASPAGFVSWPPVVLASLAAIGLIAVSFRTLGRASELATGRRLSRLVQALAVPDTVKLEVALATLGRPIGRLAHGVAGAAGSDGSDLRAVTAGKWVLDRFGEGASVVAVPQSLATPERLQTAFSAAAGPIKILQADANDVSEDAR
jgi:hypothetical protein